MNLVKNLFVSKFPSFYFHIYFLITFIGLLLCSYYFSLFSLNEQRPVQTIGSASAYVAVHSCIVLSFVLYVLSFKQKFYEKLSLKAFGLFFSLLVFATLFIRPIGSSDVYGYIYNARIFSVHHHNPYMISYSHFPQDQFFVATKNMWSTMSYTYGPVFLLVSAFLTQLSQSSFVGTLLAFKFFFIFLHGATAFFIYRFFKSKRALFLYSFNPFLLYEFGINVHNEVLLIFLLVAGMSIFFKANNLKYRIYGMAVIFLSVFVKYYTILIVPFFVIFALKNFTSLKYRIIFLASVFALLLTMGYLLYQPFWAGLNTFKGVGNQLLLTSFNLSPLMLISSSLLLIAQIPQYYSWGINLGKILFGIGSVFFILKFLTIKNISQQKVLKFSVYMIGLFLITFLTWWQPWYMTVYLSMAIFYISRFKDTFIEKSVFGVTLYCLVYYFIILGG